MTLIKQLKNNFNKCEIEQSGEVKNNTGILEAIALLNFDEIAKNKAYKNALMAVAKLRDKVDYRLLGLTIDFKNSKLKPEKMLEITNKLLIDNEGNKKSTGAWDVDPYNKKFFILHSTNPTTIREALERMRINGMYGNIISAQEFFERGAIKDIQDPISNDPDEFFERISNPDSALTKRS